MQDPKGYQQVNTVQNRDLEVTLRECSFKWKQNARILDIGCGDGSAIIDIWKKYIPGCFATIVGSDKSQACVEFAKKKYENERVKFMTLDIEGEVPSHLNGFDHVISNYTFHWVHQQEKAFSNVYDMLAKDGTCLIIFLGKCNSCDGFRQLSRFAKWSAALKDCETKFMSPYQDSQDAETEIRSMMKKIGFKDINVQVKNDLKFDFSSIQCFKDLMKCVNPFEGLKDKWEDFMDDYIKFDPNAEKMIYQLLVVSGMK